MSELPIIEPDQERGRFGFIQATEGAFRFLEDMGFRIVEATPTFVRFEARAAFVNVYHGRGSYELGVEIGRWLREYGEAVEEKFSLSDIIELTGNVRDAGLRPLVATDSQAVGKFIAILAGWTRTYAAEALAGDECFFVGLSTRAAERSDALLVRWEAERLREQAEEAWHRKDYVAVVQCYTKLARLRSISVSQSELARLRYARKHAR